MNTVIRKGSYHFGRTRQERLIAGRRANAILPKECRT